MNVLFSIGFYYGYVIWEEFLTTWNSIYLNVVYVEIALIQ